MYENVWPTLELIILGMIVCLMLDYSMLIEIVCYGKIDLNPYFHL